MQAVLDPHLLAGLGLILGVDARGVVTGLHQHGVQPNGASGSAQAVARSMIDALGPHPRRVMCAASVLGNVFWEGAVASASPERSSHWPARA